MKYIVVLLLLLVGCTQINQYKYTKSTSPCELIAVHLQFEIKAEDHLRSHFRKRYNYAVSTEDWWEISNIGNWSYDCSTEISYNDPVSYTREFYLMTVELSASDANIQVYYYEIASEKGNGIFRYLGSNKYPISYINSGNCPTPNSIAADGSRCGGRAASEK